MDQVWREFPQWGHVRPAIPIEPCIFTSADKREVREYEGALLRDLPWPTNAASNTKAVCVRVIASQMLPLMQEYTQIRDHLQGYLGALSHWHSEVLMPCLTKLEATMDDLKSEVQTLKLRMLLLGQQVAPNAGPPPSIAPSGVSAAPSSVAESIAEAQAIAASLRAQGPAMMCPPPGSSMEASPNPLLGQAVPNQGQGHVGPNPGQAGHGQEQMFQHAHPNPGTQSMLCLPTYIPNQLPAANHSMLYSNIPEQRHLEQSPTREYQ